MRRYETIIIIDPDVKEDARSGLIERVNELIPQHGGFLVELDDWGQRRMAYEIRKKIRGYYTRVDFCGDGALVDELERTLRIDDRVIKYMTVLLEKDADVTTIRETVKQKKAQKEAEKAAQLERRQKDADRDFDDAEGGRPSSNEFKSTEEE